MATSIVCDTDKVYAKITKMSMEYADEEDFMISYGGQGIYYAPSLVDDEERVIETCLQNTPNQQYTLELYDYSSDSWTSGAWISIQGINGNVVLKTMMTEEYEEYHPLSLYSPINKGSSWKFTNSAPDAWKESSYIDSEWTTYTPGDTSITSSGTQYYRHQFDGIPNMAV